mgnify:FL=1
MAVSYNSKTFNVVDIEKGVLVFPDAKNTERKVYSIDWRCDGNLLLLSGESGRMEVFDIRTEKCAQKFNDIHSCTAFELA